jgi:hypothetical protein
MSWRTQRLAAAAPNSEPDLQERHCPFLGLALRKTPTTFRDPAESMQAPATATATATATASSPNICCSGLRSYSGAGSRH